MKRDGAPNIHRLSWATGAAARLLALAGRVGADPLESGDAALRRRLLVLMSVGTLPLTLLWSAIYFAAGAPLAALAPAVYSVITPINTALLGWTRNLRLYRFTQLLMTLVLPWLVMMSLGGFKESSVVIIWAALCPARLSAGRGSAPDPALDRGLRPAPDRERHSSALSLAVRTARGVRYLVLRAESRQRDRYRLRAALLFRRAAEFLPGTLGDAAAQYPAEGNLGSAQNRTEHHRCALRVRKRPVRRRRRLHADGGGDDALAPGRSPQRGLPLLRRSRREI